MTYSSNYPHVYLQYGQAGMNTQWLVCSVCNVRVENHLLSGHGHADRVITYPRRNLDGSLDMRCAENRAAADKLAAAEALLAKKRAEAEALAAAEALLAKNLFFSEGAMPQPTPAQVDAAARTRAAAAAAVSAAAAEVAAAVATVAAPMPPSALQLAEQLEKAILTEAKRRVEKEKADEEARIQAEAKRRLEAERAAAAQRRNDDVEARIQAAMEQFRIIQ